MTETSREDIHHEVTKSTKKSAFYLDDLKEHRGMVGPMADGQRGIYRFQSPRSLERFLEYTL